MKNKHRPPECLHVQVRSEDAEARNGMSPDFRLSYFNRPWKDTEEEISC